jgi:7-cyano-7-deazaguanine synthase
MAEMTGSGVNRSVLVVLSGGMDSCVCAALAVRDAGAERVAALHVSYGQRTEAREQQAFRAICDRLGITRRLMVRNDSLSVIGGSALTDSNIEVPVAGPEIGNEVPITYVPFRNAHFLSVAVSWGEVIGAEEIYIGAVQQDSSGYPDCRPEYYRAFNELIRVGTKDGNIRISTPLISMRKSEIVTLGLEVAAPLDLSWSCYSGEQEACGVCESCVLRLRAFEQAGAVDPIPYRSVAARL